MRKVWRTGGKGVEAEAVPTDDAGNTEDRSPGVPLAGRQDISGLVHNGRVALHAEDGSIVELWGPEATEDGEIYRVRIHAELSERMKERYPEPFPEQATTLTWQGDYVDVGSELYGRQGFEIDGWGQSGHWLLLPHVTTVRLITGGQQCKRT